MRKKRIDRNFDQITYDMLTVQPMYLYADDLDYLKEHHPHVLKEDMPNLDFKHPNPVVEMLANNGWSAVKDECRMEADMAVCAYRREKYRYLIEDVKTPWQGAQRVI